MARKKLFCIMLCNHNSSLQICTRLQMSMLRDRLLWEQDTSSLSEGYNNTTNQSFMKWEVGRTQNSAPVVGTAVGTPKGAMFYDLAQALGTECMVTAEAPWQTLPLVVIFHANLTLHLWEDCTKSSELLTPPQCYSQRS